MNRERLVHSFRSLRWFIDTSLAISPTTHSLIGFHHCKDLLDAVSHNTYVETVSLHADSLHNKIKNVPREYVKYAQRDYINKISKRFRLYEHDVILAFDYTDEDFYGKVEDGRIYGWTGDHGVTGKFKFFTCSIVSDNIPQKIPLISIPVHVGHDVVYVINHCLSLVKDVVGKIVLMLFDKTFYDKSVMYDFQQQKLPYLIFVPKLEGYLKNNLASMKQGEMEFIEHEYKLNMNKTTYRYKSTLAFLRQIHNKKNDKEYDWIFATNVDSLQLNELIKTYKKRWRIETGFRVQDEAAIKSKSKEVEIRYFYFVFQQVLQAQWHCFFKQEVSFKRYIIELQRVCSDLIQNTKKNKQ